MILVKTAIYRFYSLGVLLLIALLITHDFKTAFAFAGFLEFVKLIQYYLFEKVWKRLFA